MSSEATPMMKQYHAMRRDLPPGTFLLFRLGDFYEMFFDDAREASGILNVALTKRGEVPMCGVPYHAARSYTEKLLAAGKRVAFCEQVGEVQAGKLVRREITRIVSPGTLEDAGLEEKNHNFTAAVLPPVSGGNVFGFACADLSTGEFRIMELPSLDALLDEIVRTAPAEILVPEGGGAFLGEGFPAVEEIEAYPFDALAASELLQSHFKVHSLDGFGCADLPRGVAAAGALLHYLTRVLRRDASHLRSLHPFRHADHLLIDASTQGHLELTLSRSGRGMTLLGALDRTVTPMGARTLRDWIQRPLLSPPAITARQHAVGAWLAAPLRLGRVRDCLGGIRDMERAVARLSQNSGNARDLSVLATSLEGIPRLRDAMREDGEGLLSDLVTRLHPLEELASKLRSAIVEEPPATLRDGGMMRPGFDAALDELRNASTEGKVWIAALQEQEIQRTGIKSLKVRYNAVFGYFIEVTTANLGSVPPEYTRKQTTAGGERFITPELREMEGKILGAEERAKALEIQIFQSLRADVLDQVLPLQETAAAAGGVDALASLAETARLFGYARPVVEDSPVLEISEGRHPVLDQRAGESFVPNDTLLDAEGKRMGIITGPNMAGKSTYLRQVGLLTVMAQMGSWIPAASARIGVTDRIFTRVGASDDLSRGQSTFMVEMNETANILHNATARSLVLLDEIGRGTATFDGLSLAWSIAEYLHDVTAARTLFATHYHELPDLARTRAGVKNLNVAVREQNDRIVFLRKIVEGSADRSYGIQVARLAGLPMSVIDRAKEILINLEKAELNAEGRPALAGIRRKSPGAPDPTAELPLFG